MRVAGFREQSGAQAAAVVLKNHGYDVETIGLEGEPSSRPLGELPDAVASAYWAKAFVLSNCESEYFREVVIENYGTVLWQHRPRCA